MKLLPSQRTFCVHHTTRHQSMSYPNSRWDGDQSSSMCYPPSQYLTHNEMVIGLPQCVTLQANILLTMRWWSVFLNVLPSQSMSYPSSKWDGDRSSSMCYPPSQCLTLPLGWWLVFHLSVLPSQSTSYPPIEMVIGHPPQCATLPVNILPSQRDANTKNWCLRVLSVDVVDNKLQVLCVGGTVEAGSLQTPAQQ